MIGLINVNFRSKKKGWNLYSVKFQYENSIYEKNRMEDLYMQTFLSDICLRESCYSCNFKCNKRTADITLADFWGINKINNKINDNKGISLVIINNKKGKDLFEIIKDRCVYEKVDFNKAVYFNDSYNKSVSNNIKRKDFLDEIDSNNFFIKYKKNVRKPIKNRILLFIKKIIKKVIK